MNIGCDWKISGISIYFSTYLYGIQVHYTDTQDQQYVSRWHYYDYTAPDRYEHYEFEPNEFITEFEGSLDTYWYRIIFRTNLGREISYGYIYGKNYKVTFPNGTPLIALGGTFDSYLYQLKFYVNVLGDQVCTCGTSVLGDGICTPECNSEACGNDGGDCEGVDLAIFDRSVLAPEPNFCKCFPDLVGNGYCNQECNNEGCGWDGGDCLRDTENGCKLAQFYTYGKPSTYAAFRFDELAETSVSCTRKIAALRIYFSSYVERMQVDYYDNGEYIEG